MVWRNKLSHIKTEKELFEYFEKYASFDTNAKVYICAGLASDDTKKLFIKLKDEWENDIAFDKGKIKQ